MGKNKEARRKRRKMMGKEIEDLKGRVKEAVGDITDNDTLKRSGKMDRGAAKTKEKIRQAGKKVNLDEDKIIDMETGVDNMKEKAQAVDKDLTGK